jgi:hypothetical protein
MWRQVRCGEGLFCKQQEAPKGGSTRNYTNIKKK